MVFNVVCVIIIVSTTDINNKKQLRSRNRLFGCSLSTASVASTEFKVYVSEILA